MDKQTDRSLSLWMEDAFRDKMFFAKAGHEPHRSEPSVRGGELVRATLLPEPIRRRISCAEALEAFRPLLDGLAPEPEEGWLRYAYQVATSLLYPAADTGTPPPSGTARFAFCSFLQVLFAAERRALPFDPWLDFAFCTDAELAESGVGAEYRQFIKRFRSEYIYELLRLGREVTPFRTLEHIAGVHHVAMTVSRAFRAGGGAH